MYYHMSNFSLYYIVCTSIGLLAYIFSHYGHIKTYWVLNKKIEFDLPLNYVKKEFESEITKILHDPASQGVYVFSLPGYSGKTTAVLKSLLELQNSKINYHIITYNHLNEKNYEKIKLKPMYIDVKKIPVIKNNDNWFHDIFGKYKHGQFYDTIPENTKAVIVLDHMSRNIIDGFDTNNLILGSESNLGLKAKLFFNHLAIYSYNTGFKYVVMVITDDLDYADDIMKCNAGKKFHRVIKL